MTNSSKICVRLQRPLRPPVGQAFTRVEGTVHGLSVAITLTNDELHIQPHFSGAPASVNLIELVREVVAEMERSAYGAREKR